MNLKLAGWLDKYWKRSGIHCVIRYGEASSFDKCATEACIQENMCTNHKDRRISHSISVNCDEMGLFWEQMPYYLYHTVGGTVTAGPQAHTGQTQTFSQKNASIYVKIKLSLVYYFQTLPAFMRSRNRMWTRSDCIHAGHQCKNLGHKAIVHAMTAWDVCTHH